MLTQFYLYWGYRVLEDAQNLIMAERERWQMADAEVKGRIGVVPISHSTLYMNSVYGFS